MERLQELLRRVRFWFGADRFNREMEEEMRFHMEQRANQLRAEGVSSEESVRAARLRFGNAALLRERTREAWGWSVLDSLGQDLRFALRSLRRNRGLSALVILTLGCGIGVNTAVFSVVHALLVNPYPFPHAERILALDAKHASGTNEGAGYVQFMDWKRQNTAFSAMAISPEERQRTLTGIGLPQMVIGSSTTPEFLRVLGIEPQMGRFFTEAEDQQGAPHVLVLSDAAWRKRFAADAHVLGRTVTLDGVAYTIIGVLPRGYSFPGAMTGEFLAPLLETETGSLGRRQHQYGVVARLKEGVTLAEAQNQMNMISQRLEAQYPETDKGWRVQVQTMGAWLAGEVAKPLAIFAVAVCCVLLLACVSVAGLLLARASDRAQEMAIRASLGAGRARLLRQMLTETVLLSVSGGALGIVLALALMRVFCVVAPSELGFAVSLQLNGMVLLFTVVLSLMTGLLTGLIPALAVTGANPNAVLRASGGVGLSGAWSSLRVRNRTMSWLVAGEVALAVLMLAAAGLLVKSFVLAVHTNTGLQANRVLTFSISLPRAKYATEVSRAAFFRDLLEQLRNAPGVEAVGAVDRLPMDDGFTGGAFAVEGHEQSKDREASMVEYSTTTPGYFSTMGIRVLAGRDFTAQDGVSSIPVGVIDETLARRFFPQQDPIGHRYKDDYDGQWRTIVGVVAAVRRKLPTEEPEPVVYSPHAQKQQRNMSIALRTRGAAAGMTNTVRATVAGMDADLPVQDVRTMQAVVSDAMLVERMLMQFMMGFAAFALLIVGIGVYGVVDYAVRQRRREMGIRLALGASRAAVQCQALRCGVLPALAGLAVGVPLAIAGSSLLRALLYGTGPQDVLFFALVGAMLLGLALLAGWLPARRAARMDAMTALRCE